MIPFASPIIGEREVELVDEAVRSGWVSSRGKYIGVFEKKFSEFCASRYGVACSSGTAALHVALLSCGISPGDEVIVPTLSFIATANAVRYIGAKPVFVDCDPSTWCLDYTNMKKSLTKKTKAVIPVHLYGHPADMAPILDLARAHGLYVIEDAAEAHGAQYNGRPVGSMGDVGCFSFYGNKIITTGEGGMCVTNNKRIADRIRLLVNHGMGTKKYVHRYLGFNYRITNLQAALGVAQLERIEQVIETKRRIAGLYRARLAGVRGLSLSPEANWARSVFWMFSLVVGNGFRRSRDQLMSDLAGHEIETRPFFPVMHRQPIYHERYHLPVSEHLSSRGVNLPSSPLLEEEQIEFICKCIRTG